MSDPVVSVILHKETDFISKSNYQPSFFQNSFSIPHHKNYKRTLLQAITSFFKDIFHLIYNKKSPFPVYNIIVLTIQGTIGQILNLPSL